MFNAIGYARLSRDEDKENFDSIVCQESIIRKYCEEHGINLVGIIVDDNISGYTFDRPGIRKVEEYLRRPDIQLLISKDLSRIGRHNALTLLFLEQLKNTGKHIILPDESSGGYDSSRDDDDIIGIKTWYNERYIKDISRKIRSNLRERQERGDLLIKPHFGYSIDKKQKKLVIDEEASLIVKEIFKLYLEGNGFRKIAEILNQRNIITPSRFIQEKYEKAGLSYKGCVAGIWYCTHVGNILKNDVYTGSIRQCKTRKPYIKSRAVRIRPEEQLVFEDRHEPIISKDDFLQVQRLMRERDNAKFRGTGTLATRNVNIFSGMIFCADCGAFMVSHRPGKDLKYYVCSTYHRRGKKYCTRHMTKEENLILHVKNHLLFIRENMSGFLHTLTRDIERQKLSARGQKSLADGLEKRLEMLKREYRELLSQKIRDIASNPDFKDVVESTYREMETDRLQRISSLESQLEGIRSKEDNVINFEEKTRNAISVFDSIINAELPKRSHLEMIIGRIYVNKDNNIDIQLREDIDDLCRIQQQVSGNLSIV